MKTIIRSLCGAAMFMAVSLQIHAQGFVYDQQSATNPVVTGYDSFYIQTEPLTQSFIPTLWAIDFVQFQFTDVPNNGTNGATVYVNLWEGSPNVNSATFLSSTAPVYMPDGFENGAEYSGVVTFYFSSLIDLTIGQTYYLQPVVLSGDYPWGIVVLTNVYPNGQLYGNGSYYQPGADLWFREGILTTVPEPAVLSLIGIGGLLVYGLKRRKIALLFAGLFVFVPVIAPTPAHAIVYYLQSLGGVGSAPLPVNVNTNVPVEEVSPGVYVIKDGAPANSRKIHANDSSSPIAPGGGSDTNSSGTNQTFQPYIPQVYTTNDLWLSMDSVSNSISHIIIHPPWDVNLDNTNWNVFYTTNLLNPFEDWTWIYTTTNGETNLLIANAIDTNGFYALGYVDKI